MTSRSNVRTLCIALFGASLAACSSVPERNAALDQSRERIAGARSNPQVTALAAEELREAEASARQAEQAWTAGANKETVDHLAYLAGQRASIAQEAATGRAAQAVVAGAVAERDRMRLAERTAEATALRNKASMEQSQARVEDLEAELTALNAKKTDRGMVVTLGGVLFYSGKSQLLASGTADMIRLADFFKRNPQRMASDRLSTRSFGEEQPVAGNDTAAGRQMNRRVEIVFGPPTDKLSNLQ